MFTNIKKQHVFLIINRWNMTFILILFTLRANVSKNSNISIIEF